jgi:hypothetical protein
MRGKGRGEYKPLTHYLCDPEGLIYLMVLSLKAKEIYKDRQKQ